MMPCPVMCAGGALLLKMTPWLSLLGTIAAPHGTEYPERWRNTWQVPCCDDCAAMRHGRQRHRTVCQMTRLALNTGASTRGLVPMSRMTSAASMPAMVLLAR